MTTAIALARPINILGRLTKTFNAIMNKISPQSLPAAHQQESLAMLNSLGSEHDLHHELMNHSRSIIVFDSFNPDSLLSIWLLGEIFAASKVAASESTESNIAWRCRDVRDPSWKAPAVFHGLITLGVTTEDQRVVEMATQTVNKLDMNYRGMFSHPQMKQGGAEFTTMDFQYDTDLPVMPFDSVLCYHLARLVTVMPEDKDMIFRAVSAVASWKTSGKHLKLYAVHRQGGEEVDGVYWDESWEELRAADVFSEALTDKKIISHIMEYCGTHLSYGRSETPHLMMLLEKIFEYQQTGKSITLTTEVPLWIRADAEQSWYVRENHIKHIIATTGSVNTLPNKKGHTIRALVINCTQDDFLLITEHARKNYSTVLGFSITASGEKTWFLWSTVSNACEFFEFANRDGRHRTMHRELNYVVYKEKAAKAKKIKA